MRVAIIANPNAGRAADASRLRSFEDALASMGADAKVATTRARGDAVRLARELACDVDVLGVIGGDGTVHEVINGMMTAAGGPVPFVVIPSGAGNDLASVIDCPKTPTELVDVLRNGYAAALDVLDFGDRFCINTAGIGFEGQVNRFSQTITVVRGHTRYFIALWKALSSFSCFRVTLTTAEGTVITGEKLLVSVGNGIRTGGAFYLTPDARLDDGLMDVCIVEPMGRIRMLRLLPRSFKGRHTGSSDVAMLRTSSLAIESQAPYPMHIDGEFVESPAGRRVVTVRDRAVHMLCRRLRAPILKNPLINVW